MPMMADPVRCTFQGKCRRVVELLTMQQASRATYSTYSEVENRVEKTYGPQDAATCPIAAIMSPGYSRPVFAGKETIVLGN